MVGSVHGNAGWYGKGIYFTASGFAGETYSFHWRNAAAPALLVSRVLVGRSHVMDFKHDVGCPSRENVDSHVRDSSLGVVVIFDPAQTLPTYRVTLVPTLHDAAGLGKVGCLRLEPFEASVESARI